MLEPITIVNEAAAIAGANPLQSWQPSAPACVAYERVVKHILGLAWFSWSLRTEQLSQTAEVALTGFKFVYALPPTRIGPPKRITDEAGDPRRHFTAWLLLGDTVHADADPLFAEFRTFAAPQLWSGTFREAATVALAADLAMILKRNRQLRSELRLEAYGPPSLNDRGGKVLAAILDDSQATPSLPNPVAAGDPLTSAWIS